MKNLYVYTVVCVILTTLAIPAATPLPIKDMSCIKMFGTTRSEEVMLNRIVSYAGAHLGGVHVDTSQTPNRFYVFDAGNNRILGFAQFKEAGVPNGPYHGADIVLGQPALWDSGAANANNTEFLQPTRNTLALLPYPYVNSTMEAPRSGMMATDKDGNFYVVDLCNNRVLKFIDPFATDSIADDVWGQPDFTTRSRGLSSTKLRTDWDYGGLSGTFSAGVDVEDDGSLWVADSGNNRVLRFPQGSKTADIVLGQNSFTTAYGGTGLNQMYHPTGVRRHPVTGELFVLDGQMDGGYKCRMLVFTPPFSSGMSASREFAKISGSEATGLSWARGFALDPNNTNIVWIMDGDHCRVIAFNSHTGARTDVIGQKTIDDTSKFQGWYIRPDNSTGTIRQPDGDCGFDSDGNFYFTSQYGESPIIRIPMPLQRNAQDYVVSDGEMMKKGMNQITGRTFNDFYGMSTWNDELHVCDRNRVLVWTNMSARSTFARADHVIGQDSFTGSEYGSIDHPSSQCTGSNFVFVINTWNWEIDIFEAPITDGGLNYPPLKTLHQNYVYWDDTSANVEFKANGVAYDAENDCLWVSDYDRNRVLRIRNPLGVARVDMVLGQQSKTDGDQNHGDGLYSPDAHGFAAPWTLGIDNFGNLYVVDSGFEGRVDNSGNLRVTRFDAADLQPNPTNIFPFPAASAVFGKPDFTTDRNYYDAHRPRIPTSVAFDASNHMYMTCGSYGNDQGERIFYYPTPHIGTTPQPTEVVDAYVGQAAHASCVGDQLVIQDHTWNRVLFYAPDDTAPAVDITNAISTVYGTDATVIGGTANQNSVGSLQRWNEQNGSNGYITATQSWTIEAVPLNFGPNLITVIVTNDAGVTASDTVTVTREYLPPVITITNASPVYFYDTNIVTIAGTNGPSVTGTMWWENTSTSGVAGTFSAAPSWEISAIPVHFFDNVITVCGSNAGGRITCDSITVTAVPEPQMCVVLGIALFLRVMKA